MFSCSRVLVFADRFRAVGDAAPAFGANLVASMVGGILEYSALLVGYRNLIIVVARPLRGGVGCGSHADPRLTGRGDPD